ncbi:MAG: sigma-70 family RNA polymerase sigma factor [Planctomycetales bacterium]|nr:sigma-70 family RNA polymerase sigma factor [Planctomycetales bacterium]
MSLLNAARGGQPEAWQRIVQLYGPLVYGWARKGGLAPVDAADVTQETFTAVATQLTRFDEHRRGATFRGWLRAIVRNKVVDLLRARGTEVARGGTANWQLLNEFHSPELNGADGESSEVAADGGQPGERERIVSRALAIMRTHFDKSTWQAFWRTAIDGCSPESVAEELGISRWAVYKARSRVLHRLRADLKGLEELP